MKQNMPNSKHDLKSFSIKHEILIGDKARLVYVLDKNGYYRLVFFNDIKCPCKRISINRVIYTLSINFIEATLYIYRSTREKMHTRELEHIISLIEIDKEKLNNNFALRVMTNDNGLDDDIEIDSKWFRVLYQSFISYNTGLRRDGATPVFPDNRILIQPKYEVCNI